MKFVRENLFPIVLLGIVILAGGGLIFAYTGLKKDVDSAKIQRIQLVSTLTDLAAPGSNGGANDQMVAAAEKRVEEIKSAIGDVKKSCIEWNRARFQVLQLPLDETGKSMPAFPVNEELYREKGLPFVFSEAYLDAMNKILASLNPTVPPTQVEIETQRMQWENYLLQTQAMKGAEARPAAPTAGTPPSAVAPTINIQTLAEEKARESAKLNGARAGTIYADKSCLDYVLVEPRTDIAFAQLWAAQLNLWVTRDIVEAINAANNEIFAKGDKKARNVLNAAVKRLVKINVNEYYVLPSAEAAADTGAAVMIPTRTGRGEGEEGSSAFVRPEAQVGEVSAPEPASGLTHRGSCKDYDVLHYNFTVVMPTRFLPVLERNLLARNFHTILDVQMVSPGKAGAEAGLTGDSSLYYYGSEPVMQITISGELLLLTDWERGTWDAENNKFLDKFPPLVPAEVLQTQFAGEGNPALRPEDVSRLAPPSPPAAQ